ncbi:hypothetical protein Bpfe_009741 [Biomphalaria pfeifferi]|uniref:Uncharacterized protein n=1 Tax=Biomphalaria pfeifferi TaxID=112525 RepID=A0AAD8FDF1_BIOPF|nr:hypothetical protein Bpfe_009741 [Biomphalaria pfeifferi]
MFQSSTSCHDLIKINFKLTAKSIALFLVTEITWTVWKSRGVGYSDLATCDIAYRDRFFHDLLWLCLEVLRNSISSNLRKQTLEYKFPTQKNKLHLTKVFHPD